jgi:hypothetical protein
MSIVDEILKRLGIRPRNFGELNDRITREAQPARLKPATQPAQQTTEDIQVTDEYKKVLELLEANYPIKY